jgi:hypothetical protein
MPAKEKVTLTLPQELMDTVRELASQRGYSHFVAQALEYYIAEKRRQEVRERLIAGYQANARADAVLAAEWQPLEDEVWTTYVPPYEGAEPDDDSADSTR